jgi:hypothetical protein
VSDAHNLRSFGMGNQLINEEISKIEREFGVDLRPARRLPGDRDSKYYARYEAELRRSAASMARHYEVFYCLENTVRGLISDVMEDAYGADWWESKVNPTIKAEAAKNQQREEEMGVATRSERAIDFITFGQLGEIINEHWDKFAGTLRNRVAVGRVMKSLNTLRAPIAHCNLLPEDEVVRLRLAQEDWFRQLE